MVWLWVAVVVEPLETVVVLALRPTVPSEAASNYKASVASSS